MNKEQTKIYGLNPKKLLPIGTTVELDGEWMEVVGYEEGLHVVRWFNEIQPERYSHNQLKDKIVNNETN